MGTETNPLMEQPILVCLLREVSTVDEGIALAKKAKKGWEGTVRYRSTTSCGRPPTLPILWRPETDHVVSLRATLVKEFPELEHEEALKIWFRYQWFGNKFQVSVRREARCHKKLTAWIKKTPTWKGLKIDLNRWCH